MKFPLSQWCGKGSTVYISGQIALIEGELIEGGFEMQLRQVLKNLQAVLNEAKLTPSNLVKVGVLSTPQTIPY